MRKLNRRTLIATGTTLVAGGLLGSTATAQEGDDGEAGEENGGGSSADFERPDDVAWRYDGLYADSQDRTVAVDGRIYTLADGGVYALDAEEGSQVWETGDIGAETELVFGGDTIYVAGDPIQALDAETGEIRWEGEVSTGEFEGIGVGHGRVYTGDGTIYALDAEDGSIEWERDSIEGETTDGDEVTIEDPGFGDVSEDGVYVGGHEGLAELDPETGETEIMREGDAYGIIAGSGHVAISPGYDSRYIHEMESLEMTASVDYVAAHTIIGDTHFAIGETVPHTLTATDLSETAERLWERDDASHIDSGLPKVVGNTVISAQATGPGYDTDKHWVIALDRNTGEEQWRYTFDTPEGEMESGSFSLLTVDENTIYVSRDGELLALRSEDDDSEEPEEDDPEEEEPEDDEPTDEESDEPEESEDGSGEDKEPEDDVGAANVELSVSAPNSIARGESASVDIRVWNHGEDAADVTISLEAGDVAESTTVEIAPGDCYASFHSVPCGNLSMGENEWTVTANGETESGVLALTGE